MIIECLLLFIIIALLLFMRRNSSALIDPKIPELKPRYPIIGHIPHLFRRGKTVSEALQAFHRSSFESFKEGLFLQYFDLKPFIVVYKGEFVEILLKDSTLIDKNDFYEMLKTWLGNGLLTSTGDTWRKHRKLLNPAFHSEVLNRFMPTIDGEARKLVQSLKEVEEQESFDVRPFLSNVALRNIAATAMAVPADTLSSKYIDYLRNVRNVLEITYRQMLVPPLRSEKILNLLPMGHKLKRSIQYLHTFTTEAILARKQKRLEEVQLHNDLITKRKTFLDLVLDGDILTDTEVREQVDTIMFAGHDTTASALMWSMLLIGNHPEVQQKLRDELQFIFGDDADRVVVPEDLAKMYYMDCVIKEVLRLFPPAPIIGRKTNRNIQLGQYTIPAGYDVMLLLYLMHKDPEVFEDPEEFKPERFLDAGPESKISGSYAPFALGVRNCIGQRFAMIELKVVLARILLKYRVTALDDVSTIKMSIESIMTPLSPIRIRIHALGTLY